MYKDKRILLYKRQRCLTKFISHNHEGLHCISLFGHCCFSWSCHQKVFGCKNYLWPRWSWMPRRMLPIYRLVLLPGQQKLRCYCWWLPRHQIAQFTPKKIVCCKDHLWLRWNWLLCWMLPPCQLVLLSWRQILCSHCWLLPSQKNPHPCAKKIVCCKDQLWPRTNWMPCWMLRFGLICPPSKSPRPKSFGGGHIFGGQFALLRMLPRSQLVLLSWQQILCCYRWWLSSQKIVLKTFKYLHSIPRNNKFQIFPAINMNVDDPGIRARSSIT